MTTSDQRSGRGAQAEPGSDLSHRQIVTILSGLMVGMFLGSLDQTIVSTAIVRIANDLNGYDLQAWATTAYLITATIATPLYGKLSDIYGRKPIYLISIGIFVLGSLAAMFSNSMYLLAVWRAVQGLGGGGLMSLGMTILADIVPPRQLGRYQGYFMAVFGVSTVLGPVLGGFFSGLDSLAGVDGWRWIFLINVPLGAVAMVVVAKVLNLPRQQQEHRIDWWGSLALAICVVPLLLVAQQGRGWGWGSAEAILCYAIAGTGLILFLVIEHRMKDAAVIPLRLFKSGTFSVAIGGGVILGVSMFGGITLIPQYLQVVREYSPTASGLLMVPMMLGIMIGTMISGRITDRTGRYKVLPLAGTLIVALGMLLFAQVHYDSPLWQVMLAMLVVGVGLGGCMQTLVIAVQNAVPRRDMGASTASANFFRQIGGTLGVTFFLTILLNTLPGKITEAFGGNLPPGMAGGQLAGLQSNTSVIGSLPEAVKVPILTGFTNSLHVVFYVAAGAAVLAFIVLLFMREIPLAGAPLPPPIEGGEALLVDDRETGGPEPDQTERQPEPGTATTTTGDNGPQRLP